MMYTEYIRNGITDPIRQAGRFINARRPALPVLLAAGVLLALVATALTTARAAASDEAEPWANPALAAQVTLSPTFPETKGPTSDAPRFHQVSAGGGHTCGVRTDGTVACWGHDYYGQATPPSGTFQQVSAGGGNTCGILTDGTVTCWVWNYAGQATPPSGTFQQVSAGGGHACGVLTDGAVACWGHDSSGQATPPSGTFQQVSAGVWHTCGVLTGGAVACWGHDSSGQATPPSGTFQQVSAGGSHTCGVLTGGAVACWGDDEYGQATPPSGTFQQVSAGGGHTCGILTDGTVACWGHDSSGRATPPSGTFQQVSAGGDHTCGVRTDGAVACWGDDYYGQATPPSGTFQQVSAGGGHTCGILTDGTVACWGHDYYGQATPPSGTFQQVSAGGDHTCGVRTDGAVACWGDDYYGQATPPSGTFQQVSAGGDHTCGVRTDGAVACWGDDYYGQATPPSGTFQQVSAGVWHTCGVRTDGTVACWGHDSSGRATPPSGTFQQVSAGGWHTCGILTGGTVACWGHDYYGQATPPSGTFQQVSAGDDHTCGVRTDGAVACWGDDEYGQATPPSGTFQQVSASDDHTCGVETSGGIVCWGYMARSSVSSGGGAPPAGNEDYDADNDGLIEVSNLAQLDAIRYDLDGDGDVADQDYVAYTQAFSNSAANMGCPTAGCIGYELTADLDFDTNGNGQADAGDAYWNDGTGWFPIANRTHSNGFSAIFDGNGRTISNLYTDRHVLDPDKDDGGLFKSIDEGGTVKRMGLLSVNIIVGTPGQLTNVRYVGGLVGYSRGTIADCYVTGSVTNGGGHTGGLVGSNGGAITGSYADVDVTGNSKSEADTGDYLGFATGGLVGANHGTIIGSRAIGNVISNAVGSRVFPIVGGLAGFNRQGAITASYATGRVTSNETDNYVNGSVGGLVGSSDEATITASYATGNVNSSGAATTGGLVGGSHRGSSIVDSYAIGHISGLENHIGGLVGWQSNSTATASYWNTRTSGLTTSDGGVGKTTDELQSPTNDNPGIYSTWDKTVWDFGDQDEYPTLRNVGSGIVAPPTPSGDYDADDDGLIEVSNLSQLDAIRYDLDGDGLADVYFHDDYFDDTSVTAYAAAFPKAAANMGCPSSGCTGYELTADLDFDTNGNGQADAGDAYWNGGAGWLPIGADYFGPFSAVFDGGGHTIANLYIDRIYPVAVDIPNLHIDWIYPVAIGLFGRTDVNAVIRHVGLMIDAKVSRAAYGLFVGGLVGLNDSGAIVASYATGKVSATGDNASVGGLVGYSSDGTVATSYAAVDVSGTGSNALVGGLVGMLDQGAITSGYATGSVTGDDASVGGLVGHNRSGTITDTYAIGKVTGNSVISTGALVGMNLGTLADSYWNTETSGQDSAAGGTSFGAAGKTTAEMQSPTNDNPDIYSTWDKTVWDFGDQDEYPTLRNVGPGGGAPPEDFTAPTNVVAEAVCGDVTVTWTDGRGATSHEAVLFKSDYTGSPVSAPAIDGSHVFSSVAAGSYVVAVLAYDAKGESLHTLSNEVIVSGGCVEDFTAPTNVVAEADCGGVTVTWTDGRGAASHLAVLFKSDFTGSPRVEPATGGSHVFSGVEGGSYTAAVVAYDAKGEALYSLSNEVTVSDACAGDFTAPTNVVAEAVCGDVTVTWTDGRGATSHEAVLFKSDYTGSPRVEPATGGSHVFSGVEGGSYIAAVVAYDAKGEALYSLSNEVSVLDACDACSSADQRAALVAIYDATDGPDWTRQTHWNSTEPIGDWHGVIANAAGCVTGLYLRNSGLSGAIPADIAQLKHLETLDLQNNELTGRIPPELGGLPSLERLRLNRNELTGTIPTELGNLRNLQELDLGQNQLRGKIPWQSLASLNDLQWLYLNEQSYFPGQFISDPQFINDDANYLHGSLPANVGSYPPNLAWLDLSNNRLSGEIPQTMERLDGLGGLYLSGNQFTGCVPALLLEVSTNDLADLGLSTCFDVSSDRAALLALYEAAGGGKERSGWNDGWRDKDNWGSTEPLNQWEGVTTNDDGRVIRLNLGSNRLEGELPAELGNLTVLQTLNLSGNKLAGTIPPELGNLSRLDELRLNDNKLEDPIPSALGEIASLETLYLAGNNFVRCVPRGLHEIAEKPNADIDYQHLLDIPCNINAAERKALLAIYKAATGYNDEKLEEWATQKGCYVNPGVINLRLWCGVEHVDDAGRVAEFDLSGNDFTGTISPELGKLTGLTKLDLSDNELTGGILAVRELTNLTALNLSDNKLEGPIQTALQDLGKLTYLNLSNYKRDSFGSLVGNRFEGDINFIGKLENLRHLYLRGNQFSGQVTCDFATLTKLENLDLAENQLRGDITPVIVRLSQITENVETMTVKEVGEISYDKGFHADVRRNQWKSNYPDDSDRTAEYWSDFAGKVLKVSQGNLLKISVDGQDVGQVDLDKIRKTANAITKETLRFYDRSALLSPTRKGSSAWMTAARTAAVIGEGARRAARVVYWAGPFTNMIAPIFANKSQAVFFFNMFIDGVAPFEASQKYFASFGIKLNCGLFTLSGELCKAYKTIGSPDTPLTKEDVHDPPCGG